MIPKGASVTVKKQCHLKNFITKKLSVKSPN